MEVKIQSENILAAAKQCKEAKRVLERLFPDVFAKDTVKIEQRAGGFCNKNNNNEFILCISSDEKYFVLSSHYNWSIRGFDLIPIPFKSN